MANTDCVLEMKSTDSNVLELLNLIGTIRSCNCLSVKISVLKKCTAIVNQSSVSDLNSIFTAGPNNQKFCAGVRDVINAAVVPPFDSRDYFSYDETDFKWCPNVTEGVISFLSELFSTFNQYLDLDLDLDLSHSMSRGLQTESEDTRCAQTETISKSHVGSILDPESFSWLSNVQPEILIIIGAHLECQLWSSASTQQMCHALLDQLLDLYKVPSVSELMCCQPNDLKERYVKRCLGSVSNSCTSNFAEIMHYCKMRLGKEQWPRNPFLAEAFSWTVSNAPYLSEHINQIMVTSLNFIDDHQTVNKIKGIKLIHHLLLNTSSEEMRWYNWAEVIYQSLSHQLYSKEPVVMERLLSCLLQILRDLEPLKPDGELARHQVVYERLLQDAESENLLALRRVYVLNLRNLTDHLGSGCIRHLRTIVRIIVQYLEIKDGPYDQARYGTLNLLRSVVAVAWPRIGQHAPEIMQSLCKFLLDINTSNLPRDRKSLSVRFDLNVQVVEILKLYKQLVPEVQPCLQTLIKCGHFDRIRPLLEMA